ncbi:MAG: zinc-ribbon domain-containing protein [Promethearchaeota archaeon]|jgi:hypothetical protein
MEDNTKIQFYQFGKHLHTAAIASVLSFIFPFTPFAGLIALFFIFSALGDIKVINYEMFNLNLKLFRKYYIRAAVVKMIGIVSVIGGAIVLGISLGIPPVADEFYIIGLPITITILVTGVILNILSSTIEMKAWENLKIYFMTNKSLFPENMRHNLIDGCDNLRNGALSWALGIFIIPAIVGWIIQAVGFFKLAKLNNLMYYEQAEPQVKKETPQAPPSVVAQPDINPVEIKDFCPNCGSELEKGGKFCPVCGSQILITQI